MGGTRPRGPLLGVAAGLGLLAVYFRLDPAHYPFPRCPLLLLTGLHCPGCGSQRALHALLHGELRRAAGLNLLAVLCVPVLLVGAVDGAKAWIAGQPQRMPLLYKPWLAWLVAGLTVAFAILRNLPGPAGQWLAP